MRRLPGSALLAVAVVLTLAAPAQAARCPSQHIGPYFMTDFQAIGTTCAAARGVMRAWFRAYEPIGGYTGRAVQRVRWGGRTWRCRRERSISDYTVSCTSGQRLAVGDAGEGNA